MALSSFIRVGETLGIVVPHFTVVVFGVYAVDSSRACDYKVLAAVHRHVAHSSFPRRNPGALAVDAVIEPCRGGEPQNILIPLF